MSVNFYLFLSVGLYIYYTASYRGHSANRHQGASQAARFHRMEHRFQTMEHTFRPIELTFQPLERRTSRRDNVEKRTTSAPVPQNEKKSREAQNKFHF